VSLGAEYDNIGDILSLSWRSRAGPESYGEALTTYREIGTRTEWRWQRSDLEMFS